MTATPSYLLKRNRANAHLEALQAAVDGWGESNPYAMRFEFDPQTQETLVRFDLLQPVPEILPVIMGDFLFDLRCALDHIVFALALKEQGGVLSDKDARSLQFPICKTRAEFAKARGMSLLPPGVVAFIETIQPYNGGDVFEEHTLGAFNELSNADKHRALNIVAATKDRFVYTGTNVTLEAASMTTDLVLEDGAELLRFLWRQTDPRQTGHVDLDLAVHVSLAQPSLGSERVLLNVARWLYRQIDGGILRYLEPFL